MVKLLIMVGVPASGKSTFCLKMMRSGDIYISRDQVRFSLLNEDDKYFAKETLVFHKFIKKITESCIQAALDTLSTGETIKVFVDATHISWGSRKKLLNALKNSGCLKFVSSLCALCFPADYETVKERNAQRQGRERVPESALRDMYEHFTIPSLKEGFDHIYIIKSDTSTGKYYYKEEDNT